MRPATVYRKKQNLDEPPRGLSEEASRILVSVVSGLRPRCAPLDMDIDADVAATALSFVPFMPAPARTGLEPALRFLEFAPVLRGFGMRRMTSLEPDEAGAYLASWENSLLPMATLYQALRSLVMISFYQHPAVLKVLDVDWEGRAVAEVGRRAAIVSARSET